jgi:hypothetical protein
MTKDGSKLFSDVSDEVYARVFEELQNFRFAYPQYRDDQLLMKMLCNRAVLK